MRKASVRKFKTPYLHTYPGVLHTYRQTDSRQTDRQIMTTHAHLPQNDHPPLSPTFADSAIDTDTDTDNDVDVNAQQLPRIPFSGEVQKAPELQAVATTTTIERQEVAERLAELAQRVSSLSEEEEEGTAVSEDVVRCLEILERTLPPPDESGHATKEGYGDDEDEPDPRAAFVQEIAKHRRRPRSYPSTTTTTRSFHRSWGAPSPSTIGEVPARAQATDPQPSPQPQPQPQLQLQHILDQITALNHDLTARRNESSHVYDLFTRRCQGLERSVAVLQEEVREL